MVSLDKAIIARLKTGGETFEIYVDPDLAIEYKKGTNVLLEDLLAVQEVFKDASTGKKASAESMVKAFGTSDLPTVVDRIIHKGEIHLTAEQRKKMIDEKRRQIITYISRNSINPQTKAPNPPARIEAAMEEARVQVDPFKSAKEQVETVVKEIRPILPIKFDTVQMAVKIPAAYANNSYRILREYGEVKKEGMAQRRPHVPHGNTCRGTG